MPVDRSTILHVVENLHLNRVALVGLDERTFSLAVDDEHVLLESVRGAGNLPEMPNIAPNNRFRGDSEGGFEKELGGACGHVLRGEGVGGPLSEPWMRRDEGDAEHRQGE